MLELPAKMVRRRLRRRYGRIMITPPLVSFRFVGRNDAWYTWDESSRRRGFFLILEEIKIRRYFYRFLASKQLSRSDRRFFFYPHSQRIPTFHNKGRYSRRVPNPMFASYLGPTSYLPNFASKISKKNQPTYLVKSSYFQ